MHVMMAITLMEMVATFNVKFKRISVVKIFKVDLI
jgi:hypothetical protein